MSESKRIQIKRGLKEDLPDLSEGEYGLCTDTKEVYIGTATSTNIKMATSDDIGTLSAELGDITLLETTDKTSAVKAINELNTTNIGNLLDLGTSPQNIVKSMIDRGVSVKDNGAKGDGLNDDTSAIQNMLTIAKTLGGVEVIIPDGTYKLTATLRVYGNTKLKMSKNAKLLRCHTASFFVNGDATDSFTLYAGHSNITVEGGVLDGNILAFPEGFNAFGLARGKGLTFRDIEIRDVVYAHAFDINACDDILIDNCRFLGFKDNTVDNSRYYAEAIQISNHTSLGFSGFGAWDGYPTRNIKITNCYFGASGTTGTVSWGAAIGGHGAVYDTYNSDILISGNTFDGMTYAGVRDFKFRDVRIVNNAFLGCVYGIAFSNASAGSESSKRGDGTQSNLPQSGDGLIVMGNQFKDTVKSNIYINGQVSVGNITKAKNIDISHNQFINQSKTDGYDNIYIKWVDKVKFTDNIVDGSYRGFNVQYSSNVDIDQNQINDCKYEGIWVYEDAAEGGGVYQNLGYTSKINIRHNKVEGTGRTAIMVQYTDDFDLIDNKIYSPATELDNNWDGINCSSSAKNGRILDNKIRMATSGNQNKYGIEVTGSCSNIQVFNNDAEGKTGRQFLPSSVPSVWAGYYIHSANGTRYKVTVSDAGAQVITAG